MEAPARLGEGDEIALLQADERPGDGHAVTRGHRVHAPQARDAGTAQQAKQHGLRLIVGVMGGHDRVGADRLGVVDEQAVARFARALLHAGRGLRAFPLKNAVADAEPGAERGDRLRLLRALGPKAVIDRRRLDPVLPRRFAHSAAIRSSAVESGPPETAISSAFARHKRREQRVDVGRRQRVRAPGAQQ